MSYRWYLLGGLPDGSYAMNNTFSITLTPLQALQTKVGYESQGYQVQMMEVHKASHIDNTYKYHFTLSGGGVAVTYNNNNLLEVA